MGKQMGVSLIKPVDKNTPFNEALRSTQTLQGVYAGSSLIYLLVAKILSSVPSLPRGFVQWPESQYEQLLWGAAAITAIVVGITFLLLPKITSPAALIQKKQIASLEELGYELRQTHILKIVVMQIPAILGLVLFLFNGHWLHMIPFVLVNLFLLAATAPTQSAWEKAKMQFESHQLITS